MAKNVFMLNQGEKPRRFDKAISCKTCSHAIKSSETRGMPSDARGVVACDLHMVVDREGKPAFWPTTDQNSCAHHPSLSGSQDEY